MPCGVRCIGMGNIAPNLATPQNYEPLSVRGSAVEFRIAHALEALAGAICRIDQRLESLVEQTKLK